MITLKYPSLKANSMSWKLKCQDCKNRHVGHLWPSWAGQGVWHGDISRGLITAHHTSLSLGSGNSLDHKSRAFFSSLWAADGPGGNIHPAAAVRGAPREAWSCPVDTGTVKMWQGYNESCVNMSVASSLWSESKVRVTIIVMDNNNSLARTRMPSGSSYRRNVRKSESEGSRKENSLLLYIILL